MPWWGWGLIILAILLVIAGIIGSQRSKGDRAYLALFNIKFDEVITAKNSQMEYSNYWRDVQYALDRMGGQLQSVRFRGQDYTVEEWRSRARLAQVSHRATVLHARLALESEPHSRRLATLHSAAVQCFRAIEREMAIPYQNTGDIMAACKESERALEQLRLVVERDPFFAGGTGS